MLSARHQLVVRYADAFLGAAGVPAELQAEMLATFTGAEVVELTMALAMFHGFSKMLVVLGLEPEHMDTTVLPTPGSQPV